METQIGFIVHVTYVTLHVCVLLIRTWAHMHEKSYMSECTHILSQ